MVAVVVTGVLMAAVVVTGVLMAAVVVTGVLMAAVAVRALVLAVVFVALTVPRALGLSRLPRRVVLPVPQCTSSRWRILCLAELARRDVYPMLLMA
jgi:hypothetical protein